jgi:hypothetical protein
MCTRLVAGFRLPDLAPRPPELLPPPSQPDLREVVAQAAAASQPLSRAERLAASLAPTEGLDRRTGRLVGALAMDAAGAGPGSTTIDRRTEVAGSGAGLTAPGPDGFASSDRLGQMGRRRSTVVRRQTLPSASAPAGQFP